MTLLPATDSSARETRLRRAITLPQPATDPRGLAASHRDGVSSADAASRWQVSSRANLERVFTRIITALSLSAHGQTAAKQFTIFLRHSAPHISRVEADQPSSIFGQPVHSASRPIGTALIVSAPSCDPFIVTENIAAALVARNCVELALFEQPEPELSAVIAALQQILPEGVFSVLHDRAGWGGRGPETAIIILTPDQWFLTNRDRVRSGVPVSPRAMVGFYSR
ncbi:hypothetical protein B7R21_15815 [Subtercola boreus]|uniref:Aldehyde dehydrogenase domain-containing protein n=1 Tax=Subtercola boreus TaxID=120213 RepID=A0A3E0VDU1_9MICO|nr:hypothetical protein [Subtercola boreus]RFA07638.1 hypothetical protein B7R21_15815 [Subtercola boreus]